MSVKNLFIKIKNIPFISIILFILVIILNVIQYNSNNSLYLQTNLLKNMDPYENTPRLRNSLLIIYEMFGINSLLVNSLWYIIYLFIAWGLMSIIEINIGHISLIYFIIMIFGVSYLINTINTYSCLHGFEQMIITQSVTSCCSSQIMFSALGFFLMLYLLNVQNKYIKIIILLTIIGAYIGLVCYDKYVSFKGYKNTTCDGLTWHSLYFLFGLFSGYIIRKKN
jgi:hypothetical protein